MIKEITTLFCFAGIVYSAPSPYQYNTFSTVTSTPSYMTKQSLNLDNMAQKYGVGYKVQDAASNKVKKEYSNTEYQNLFSPDIASKRPQNYNAEFTSFDDTYSTTSASSLPYPYTGKLATLAPNPFTSAGKAYVPAPPTASSKVFVHDHDHHGGKHHFVHDVVGHYITDVAGHKLKHVGEVLESGLLTEPIIHKLSFAKAALLQLLAIIGPLSAIKTIHVVAKASEPHHPHAEPEHEVPAIAPGPAEHGEGFGHHSYPPTLVGIIMHFVASLSKFNTDAKLHLIPNLLKIVSSASAASSRVSGHHAH